AYLCLPSAHRKRLLGSSFNRTTILKIYSISLHDALPISIDLESGGNAYLIQKGKVNPVQWERQDGKLSPVKDGDPLGFVPGKTWVNVVPANPGLEQSVMIE